MQQYQQGYRHRDGTDGVNKLFRMGVKALYKSYYGNNRIQLNSDDDISSSFSDIEYKLGVSTDKVRLGLEYDFQGGAGLNEKPRPGRVLLCSSSNWIILALLVL